MKPFVLISLLAAMILLACNSKSSDEDTDTLLENMEPAEPLDTFFAIMVEDLRLRDSFTLNSNVLTKLKKETEVEYLHERSDFTQKINIGGARRDEPWYKVVTLDGQHEGWVYGGGIQLIDQPSSFDEPKLDAERLVYTVDNGLKDNLETIFNLVLPGQSNRFKGFYEYKPGLAGNRILDGNIRLETRYIPQDQNVEIEVHIQGRYRNGKKDGAFTCRSYMPDSETVATLYYEESQDKCIWGSFHGTVNDQSISFREDQPIRCDFDYLQEKAIEQ